MGALSGGSPIGEEMSETDGYVDLHPVMCTAGEGDAASRRDSAARPFLAQNSPSLSEHSRLATASLGAAGSAAFKACGRAEADRRRLTRRTPQPRRPIVDIGV